MVLPSPEIIASFINQNYPLNKPAGIEILSQGLNHTYLVNSDNKFIFRVYISNQYYGLGPSQYLFELELQDFLARSGMQVPRPLASKENGFLIQLDYGAESCCAALFTFAHGKPHASWHPKINEAAVRKLGNIIADLHNTADDFETSQNRYHFDEYYLIKRPLELLKGLSKPNRAEKNLDFLYETIAEIQDTVTELGKGAGKYGIIHGDLHVGNIFYDEEKGYTIIDFDHCAFGWRVYDLVPLLNTLRINVPGQADKIWPLILEGYREHRSLTEAEIKAIPAFAFLWQLWDIGEILAVSREREGAMELLTGTNLETYLDNSLVRLAELSKFLQNSHEWGN